ncbi:MAG: hypothetical protein M0Q52_03240 [Lascolabacillus sp.]|nr:hypothetical protein [Lascolabacillus sp.]
MKKFKVLFVSVFTLFITGCESSIDTLNNEVEGEIEFEIKGEKEVKEVKEEKEEDHTNGNSIEDWEVDADSTLYELKPSGGGGLNINM